MYVTCMSVCACVRICYSACLYVSHCTFHAFKKNKCNMFEYVFYRCINQKYCIHFYAILRVYLSSQLYEFHPLNIAILVSMKFKLWIFDYFMSKTQEIYFKSFLCTYINYATRFREFQDNICCFEMLTQHSLKLSKMFRYLNFDRIESFHFYSF